MKVWIDQDLCTGDGLCEEIAPDVFVMLDDGLAYVREGDKIFAASEGNPEGAQGMANFPDDQMDLVVEAVPERMALYPGLLEILACPEDKGPLVYLEDEDTLYNPRLGRRYDIRDDIPVLLIDEATALDADEVARLDAKIEAEGLRPTFEA